MPRRAEQPTPAPRRTQRERTEQAAQALLDAASELFALRGVDQTSLADIGERAGYSRGLANHHFGSKAILVEQLAKRFQNQFVDGLVVDPDRADTIEALEALVETYLTRMGRRSEVGRAFFVMWGAALPADAPLRPVFAADDVKFRAGVETLLRHGQDNGSIDEAVDPASGAVAVVGMLRGVAAQYLVDPKQVDVPAAVQMCRQFVRQSFAPRRAER